MKKNLLKKLIMIIFILIPLLMVSNNPATADSQSSKLLAIECCEVTITPSSVEAMPGDTVQFSTETICIGDGSTEIYMWEFNFGCIGSIIGPVYYRAGEPAPGNTTCTDTIKVTDVANGNISATATVVVSALSTTTTSISTTTICKSLCCTEEIYGEYSKEIELLRYIRDNVLNQTPEGRELIKLYYQWSPMIVKAMAEDEEFKEEVKELIDGVLRLVGETE